MKLSTVIGVSSMNNSALIVPMFVSKVAPGFGNKVPGLHGNGLVYKKKCAVT